MQNRIKRMKLLSVILFIFTAVSLIQLPAAAESTGITLEESSISLTVGKSYQLKWSVLPSDEDQSASFYSKNTKVANVSSDGLIVATGEGSAKVVVTSADGLSFTTCKVTVTENTETEIISLADTELYLKSGSSSSIFYSYNEDEYVFSKSSSFTSDDEEIASVSENGTIKAVSDGTATIKATFGKTTRTCKVYVGEDEEYVSGRKVSGTLMNASDKLYKKAKIAISYVKDKENYYAVTTTDSYGAFAFSGISDGTYTLVYYDESSDKLISSNEISVSGKDISYTAILNKGTMLAVQGEIKSEANTTPKSVSLADKYLTMNIGDIEELSVVTSPRDADITKLKITSSDESVVAINDSGELVAKKNGYAEITYTTPDGKSSAVCTVNVLQTESTEYSLIYIAVIFLVFFIIIIWFVRTYKKFMARKRLREDMYD